MNYKNIMIGLGVVTVTISLVKLAYDWARVIDNPPPKDLVNPKVKKMVAETLKEHQGEESPFVQAFAKATE